MADTPKEVLTSRTDSHADVADTPAARAFQQGLASRQFGDLLVKRVREGNGDLRLRNFKEEWINADDGLVYEISVEVEAAE